jgi:hypothetical protein
MKNFRFIGIAIVFAVIATSDRGLKRVFRCKPIGQLICPEKKFFHFMLPFIIASLHEEEGYPESIRHER